MKKGKDSEKLEEAPAVYGALSLSTSANMVRTQIYLEPEEHAFLLSESARKGESMAALIRSYIQEKMKPSEDLWLNNPLLEPTPDDPDFEGHTDAALNLDYYIYGSVTGKKDDLKK